MTNHCKKNLKWLDYPENKPRKQGYYFTYLCRHFTTFSRFSYQVCFYNNHNHKWFRHSPLRGTFTVLGFIKESYAKYGDGVDLIYYSAPEFEMKFKIGVNNDRHRNIKTKRTTI